MDTQKITISQLVEILKLQKRGTFINFTICTIPKMRKTNNPFFDKVTKTTTGNVLIGGDYSTRVENNTGVENYIPEKCNVGEHIGEGNCIIFNENKQRFYLQYEWFGEVKPKSEFTFEGNPIEKQLFESYMGTFTPNKFGVQIQSVMVNNIKFLTLNKVRYEVVESVEVTTENTVEETV